MDACLCCPYYIQCAADPNFKCFLDQPDRDLDE